MHITSKITALRAFLPGLQVSMLCLQTGGNAIPLGIRRGAVQSRQDTISDEEADFSSDSDAPLPGELDEDEGASDQQVWSGHNLLVGRWSVQCVAAVARFKAGIGTVYLARSWCAIKTGCHMQSCYPKQGGPYRRPCG